MIVPDDSSVGTIRSGGRQRAAARFDCLFSGDQIRVEKQSGYLEYVDLQDPTRTRRIDRGSGSVAIMGRVKPVIQRNVEEVAEGLSALWRRPRPAIMAYGLLEVRGGAPAAASELPAGIQYVPIGTSELTFLWRGAPAAIQVLRADGRIQLGVPASPATFTEVKIPSADGARVVVGSSLTWNLRSAARSSIPEPAWMARDLTRSDEERVLRAIWILQSGPPSWRLFALSELSQLAQTDYLADRALLAVLSGEGLPH